MGGKLRVQAVKVHRIPYATFFFVILVDQKGKEATHSEQVGSESMNQLTHINKLDQLTHWQRSKCQKYFKIRHKDMIMWVSVS